VTLVREHPLVVRTARVDYSGEHGLDVSRSGKDPLGLAFAPSWEILRPALALREQGRETNATFAAYAEAYRGEMRQSFVHQRAAWSELLSRQRVVLLCYCNLDRHPDKCHRIVLAEILAKCGAVYLGELRPDQYSTAWLDMGAAEGGAR
jgi:uncharacterized protein YeaO (DUF488 family)